MEKKAYALEIGGIVSKVFASVEKAKQVAYDTLVKWDFDPVKDEEIFKELEESFNDQKHSGFWVEELLYCYEVDYFE